MNNKEDASKVVSLLVLVGHFASSCKHSPFQLREM